MSYVAAPTEWPRPPVPGSPHSVLRHVPGDDGLSFEPPVDAADCEPGTGTDIDIRQLRHHTKNTLQRILGLISEASGLRSTPEGQKIAQELEHRIFLSASISNALFGLTDAPASMAERLRQLSGAIVGLMRRSDQIIRIGVSVRGNCPMPLRDAVMRAAHELIGNAVKHGMHDRPSGRIAVRLVTDDASTTLTVVDNGWGFIGCPQQGEGLALARSFAEMHGGTLTLDGADGTVATMKLPHWPANAKPE